MNFEQLYAPSLKELFVQKLQGMILSGESKLSSGQVCHGHQPGNSKPDQQCQESAADLAEVELCQTSLYYAQRH